mmetsp:Transcript_3473/g.13254  ORF Transcript_3473/g.13254 Transcript_3473/m.13254 type:complete len:84 (-) Transcript_3473:129-380(-)|eukprot:CAMPEP_0117436812 /NCGR_PEP_ID=MMETSP0759-20121206/1199_1 /TAXON_ID=63605 /ORGANISM="Percolomonas cosmopolitus, Strain WS" /LENGTH=83 /DNA_ID=CAMNT_0005228421 /DNA_START=1169 /DNA_END=1420 /DNA_ORIENTATION=+
MTTVNVAGYRRVKQQKKKPKVQSCTDEQVKTDQKLGFGKLISKGLEALDRKQLNKVAKKHEVKAFGKSSAKIIEELREKAQSI